MKSPINRRALQEHILNKARSMGRTRFTRVSAAFLAAAEKDALAHLDLWLEARIHRHPSVGITLKG